MLDLPARSLGLTLRVAAAAVAILAGLLGPPRAAAQALDSVLVVEIEATVQSLIDSVPWPGAAVGIVVVDSLAFARGFGLADRVTGSTVTPSTLFQIGSVSKSFTATLAGMLVERRRLSWSDRLSARLPAAAKLPAEPITLGQIASHMSGLPGDAPTLRRKHGDYPILAFTHFELYQSLAESELAFPPGTAWGYSNFGYAVLGHVLELATGLPYEVLLTAELFEPLGMTSSTVTIWPELAPRLATPYIADEERGDLVQYTPWDQEALAPAGGIASTLVDMGRWVGFQLRARAGREGRVGASMVRDLQSARWTFPSGTAYGVGWFVERLDGVGEVISVGGEVDGYTSEIAFAPGSEVGVVVMVNRGDAVGLPDLTRWLLATVVGGAGLDEARYRRGLLHQTAGEWRAAFQAFASLTERGAPDLRALYQVGRTGALSGQFLAEAEDALERYLDRTPEPDQPSHAAARWRLAMVHQRSGRCADAEQQYMLALEADPGLMGVIEQDRRAIGGCEVPSASLSPIEGLTDPHEPAVPRQIPRS